MAPRKFLRVHLVWEKGKTAKSSIALQTIFQNRIMMSMLRDKVSPISLHSKRLIGPKVSRPMKIKRLLCRLCQNLLTRLLSKLRQAQSCLTNFKLRLNLVTLMLIIHEVERSLTNTKGVYVRN